jgi:hypothetical protein
MSPFSAPFFWGTQKRRLLLPRRAAAPAESQVVGQFPVAALVRRSSPSEREWAYRATMRDSLKQGMIRAAYRDTSLVSP